MFYLDIDPREEVQANLIEQVRSKLQAAFVQAKHVNGASLQTIADKLKVNKSAIHRQMSGESNLTLKTIADLSWALDKVPSFDLKCTSRHQVQSASNSLSLGDLQKLKTISANSSSRNKATVDFIEFA